MSDQLHDESPQGTEPLASVRDDQSASIRVATVTRVRRRRSGQWTLTAANLEDHLDLRSATGGHPDGAAISQATDQRKAETASRFAKWFEPFPLICDDNLKLVSEIADAYLNDAVEPVVVCVLHRVGDGLAHAQLDAAHPLVRKSAISGDLRDDLSKRPNSLRSSFCSDLQRGGHETSYTPYTRFSQRRNMQLRKSPLLALNESLALAPDVLVQEHSAKLGEGGRLGVVERSQDLLAVRNRERDDHRPPVQCVRENAACGLVDEANDLPYVVVGDRDAREVHTGDHTFVLRFNGGEDEERVPASVYAVFPQTGDVRGESPPYAVSRPRNERSE